MLHKGVYIDEWSVLEKVCLASAVFRIGDDNWITVCEFIKPKLCRTRPGDWFTSKTCAAQYDLMIKEFVDPNDKSKSSVLQVLQCLKTICKETIPSAEERWQKYKMLKKRLDHLQKGNIDEETKCKYLNECQNEELEHMQKMKEHRDFLMKRNELKIRYEQLGGCALPSKLTSQRNKCEETLSNSLTNNVDKSLSCLLSNDGIESSIDDHVNRKTTDHVQSILSHDLKDISKKFVIQLCDIDNPANEVALNMNSSNCLCAVTESNIEEQMAEDDEYNDNTSEGSTSSNFSEMETDTRTTDDGGTEYAEQSPTKHDSDPNRTFENIDESKISIETVHEVTMEIMYSSDTERDSSVEILTPFDVDNDISYRNMENTELQGESFEENISQDYHKVNSEDETDSDGFLVMNKITTDVINPKEKNRKLSPANEDEFDDIYDQALAERIAANKDKHNKILENVVNEAEEILKENEDVEYSEVADGNGEEIKEENIEENEQEKRESSKDGKLPYVAKHEITSSDEDKDLIESAEPLVDTTRNIQEVSQTIQNSPKKHSPNIVENIEKSIDDAENEQESSISLIDNEETSFSNPFGKNDGHPEKSPIIEKNGENFVNDVIENNEYFANSNEGNTCVSDMATEFTLVCERESVDEFKNKQDVANEDEQNEPIENIVNNVEALEWNACEDNVEEITQESIAENEELEKEHSKENVENEQLTCCAKNEMTSSDEDKDFIEETSLADTTRNIQAVSQTIQNSLEKLSPNIIKNTEKILDDAENEQQSSIMIENEEISLSNLVGENNENSGKSSIIEKNVEKSVNDVGENNEDLDNTSKDITDKVSDVNTEYTLVCKQESLDELEHRDGNEEKPKETITTNEENPKMNIMTDEVVTKQQIVDEATDSVIGKRISSPDNRPVKKVCNTYGRRKWKKNCKDESIDQVNNLIRSSTKSPIPSVKIRDSFSKDIKMIMLAYHTLNGCKYAHTFQKPITEDLVPGYSNMVYYPMDLSTIKKKIDTGQIRDMVSFQKDVLLMLTNAKMYNLTNSQVFNMAVESEEVALSHIKLAVETTGSGILQKFLTVEQPKEKLRTRKTLEKKGRMARRSSISLPKRSTRSIGSGPSAKRFKDM